MKETLNRDLYLYSRGYAVNLGRTRVGFNVSYYNWTFSVSIIILVQRPDGLGGNKTRYNFILLLTFILLYVFLFVNFPVKMKRERDILRF